MVLLEEEEKKYDEKLKIFLRKKEKYHIPSPTGEDVSIFH